MKKFISGFLLGVIPFGAIVTFAAQYIADPAGFKVLVNGKEFVSDPPALVVEGRTYLPLRAMGDALGVPVKWNEELGRAEVGATVTDENGNYSRNNPAPLNTTQTFQNTDEYIEMENYTVSVRITDIERGEKAEQSLRSRNGYFYQEPSEGYEYLNAKIEFYVNETKTDFSVEPNQYQFKSFSSQNEEAPDDMILMSLEPRLTGAVYAGGNTAGWITVQVRKDDARPKLAYGLDYKGAGGIWFALYE